MDKSQKPKRFEIDPSAPDVKRRWLLWHKTLTGYIDSFADITEANKLKILINHVDAAKYELISEVDTYDEAVRTLRNIFVRPTNEIFARYQLSTCKQQSNQSIDEYLQNLKRLSKEGNYAAVTADEHRQQAIRDAFVAGIYSASIRQRLLESANMNLQRIIDRARLLEGAQRNAEKFRAPNLEASFTAATTSHALDQVSETSSTADRNVSTSGLCGAAQSTKCFFCGNKHHPRKECPARGSICFKCNKKGHFSKVCRSRATSPVKTTSAALTTAVMTISAQSRVDPTSKTSIAVELNGTPVNALLDTGASNSHVNEEVAQQLNLEIAESTACIGLAVKGCCSKSLGACKATVGLQQRIYKEVPFTMLKDLLTDVVLGQDFMYQHEVVNIHFGGAKPPLNLSALKPLKISKPPKLFQYMTKNCHPIIRKSRRHSVADSRFISVETKRLLSEGIIERSNSPWRAHVVVTTNKNHKKRMCIDYSQTVSKFTLLDGCPLPRMQDLVDKVSQYNVFSTLDLKSAYHQVELSADERIFPAFEADGQLFQFIRLPFGLKNAVPCFQRIIDNIIEDNNCQGTHAYLDNITVGGKT